MNDRGVARALTIAGSDSGGGAGIEADLKVFTVFGVYGMAAITTITAQNTVEVDGIEDVSPGMVARQIDVVARDIGVDAAKTGMLSNASIIESVAESVSRNGIRHLVVDPVMVSTSGARLLREDACDALKRALIPLALIVTPNLPEAEALAGFAIRGEDDLRRAAHRILALGPRYVLLKGGHGAGAESTDYLYSAESATAFSAPRIDTKNTHGTGCTLSAAITACLAKGDEVPEAIAKAKEYLTGALRHGIPVGQGHGPVDHAWNIRFR
ncbi:MAG: bifunctional hydroxymethylpyrimidine kinase/phosphomethylpyrimidine kinase [Candidatus Hydrogenedentes bacterium]|nr:bifunctional hydroxymethylpyrimidine kinase/phosphomethylpyrimidine kinase [Candidatus Hydrogenedentota bacterium]